MLTIDSAKSALDMGLQAIENGQTNIDLAELTAVDSAAVAVLLAWRRAALARSQLLAFHNIPPALASIAELYGVAEILAPVKLVQASAAAASASEKTARIDLPHH